MWPRRVLPRTPPTSSDRPPWPRQSSAATVKPGGHVAELVGPVAGVAGVAVEHEQRRVGPFLAPFGRRNLAWTRAPPTPVKYRSKHSAKGAWNFAGTSSTCGSISLSPARLRSQPQNQASCQSCAVPVLPAVGRSCEPGCRGRSRVGVLLEDLSDRVGHPGGDGLGLLGLRLPDHLALGVLHAQDQRRLDELALVRQSPVRGSHLERGHTVRETADGDGRVRVQSAGYPHALGYVDDSLWATSRHSCA